MNNFFSFTLAGCLCLFIVSCGNKDTSSPSSDYYIASPEKMMDMTGKDWSAVKPDLEGKKGYLYSEFPQDQNPAVKAAVSLPAVEEDQANVHYFMQLNVDRQTNRVIGPSLITIDSLITLNSTEANALLQKYYQRGLQPRTDTAMTAGYYYTDGYGQINTTVIDLLNKSSTGFPSTFYTISYQTLDGGHYLITTSKNETTGNYSFNFDGEK